MKAITVVAPTAYEIALWLAGLINTTPVIMRPCRPGEPFAVLQSVVYPATEWTESQLVIVEGLPVLARVRPEPLACLDTSSFSSDLALYIPGGDVTEADYQIEQQRTSVRGTVKLLTERGVNPRLISVLFTATGSPVSATTAQELAAAVHNQYGDRAIPYLVGTRDMTEQEQISQALPRLERGRWVIECSSIALLRQIIDGAIAYLVAMVGTSESQAFDEKLATNPAAATEYLNSVIEGMAQRLLARRQA